jgi:hypothetical protein
LNSRHANVMMRLLWEVQSYDGSVHYDVLVSSRGGETISLSLSLARSLPWPLRGILRWTEADLVQVNGRRLTIESATCFLDVLWNKIPLMEKIVDLCLLKDELERERLLSMTMRCKMVWTHCGELMAYTPQRPPRAGCASAGSLSSSWKVWCQSIWHTSVFSNVRLLAKLPDTSTPACTSWTSRV